MGRDSVPFVGSISFALLRGGFHSTSQENAEGAKRAEDLLDGVRLLADKDRFKQGRGDFLPLCDVNDKDETVIGVSFPCHVECVDDYWVILAQDDESQAIIGVDVVFEDPNLVVPDEQSLALESGTSVSSISESTRTARANRGKEAVLPLTAENLIRHDRELREVEEEETESGEERYDDEILSSSSSEGSSPYKSRSAHVVGEADSIISGWTGFTKNGHAVEIDDDANNNNTGKLGHAHGDVHMCSSLLFRTDKPFRCFAFFSLLCKTETKDSSTIDPSLYPWQMQVRSVVSSVVAFIFLLLNRCSLTFAFSHFIPC